MYNNITDQEPTGALGILMMMLPLMLMMAVSLSIFSEKRNERNRSRFGIEFEAIRREGQGSGMYSAHARALTKKIREIRKLARQGKNNTPEEGALFESFRNIVHSRYRLSEKLWKEWVETTEMQDEIPHMGYTHTVTPNMHKTVTDASLNDGGHELPTAPLMDRDINPSIQELSYALRSGSETDSSCGTHFHRGLVNPDKGWKNSTNTEKWEMIRINGVFNLIYKFFEEAINSMVAPSRHGNNHYTNALPPYFDRSVNENAWQQFRYQAYPHSTYASERTSRRSLVEGGYGKITHHVTGKPHLQHCSYYVDATGVVRGVYYNNPDADEVLSHLTPTQEQWVTADIKLPLHPHQSVRSGDLEANMSTVENAKVFIDGEIIKPQMQNAGSIVRQWNKHYKAAVLEITGDLMVTQTAAKQMLASRGVFRLSALDLIAHSAYQMVENGKWDKQTIVMSRDSWSDNPSYHIQGHYPEGFPAVSKFGNYARYSHVNPQSLKKYGTIEVRQMHGILNPTKTLMWAEFLDLHMNKAIAAVENNKLKLPRKGDFDSMMRWLDLAEDDEFRQMWRRRISVINRDGYNVQHDIKCSTCEKHYCDNDNACGILPQYDPYEEIAGDIHEMDSDDFLRHLYEEETCMTCNSCGSDSYWHDNTWEDSQIVRREPALLGLYCECCGEDELFGIDIGLLGLVLTVAMGVISPLALVVGCGIGFIHAAGKKWKYTARAKRLWGLLTERGAQAAGAGIGTQGTTKRRRTRSATTAHAVKSRLDKYCSEKTSWVMKHTRYATHGKNVMENAHPHAGPDKKVMVVHNGVVTNQDAVYKALGIESLGPVDSQAVAAALELGGIEKVVETCKGSMSLIWSDKRDPEGTIKFWSNGGNPLAFGRINDAKDGAVVCASTMDILERAFEIPTKKGKKPRSLLASAYDCTIGREYTVHADGSITHRDIEGSADTYGGGWASNWRNYSTYYDTAVPAKASGDADNCALPSARDTETYFGISRDEIMMQVYTEVDWVGDGGWPSFMVENNHGRRVKCHGFDAVRGVGIAYVTGGFRDEYYLDLDICDILRDPKHEDFDDAVWCLVTGEFETTFPRWDPDQYYMT